MPSEESVATSSSPVNSEPIATSSKKSRIHFPVNNLSPSRQIHRTTETPPWAIRETRISLARRSPLNPHTVSTTSRRRVRSVGTSGDTIFLDSSPGRRKHTSSLLAPSRGLESLEERSFDTVGDDHSGVSLFSDEYDLSHEDPRILQDVQRALKLKARREARLSSKSTPPRSEGTSSHQQIGISPTLNSVLPASPTTRKQSMSSDIDFSPSTGAFSLHPVPASLDNGMTLDWSGLDDKPESRWRLTVSKRKGKEMSIPLMTVMEQQEAMYADKIARLRADASPHTVRKAKITQDQLGRRYNAFYGSMTMGNFLNVTEVVRWYAKQDALVRSSLEKAEPFTWLKHLDKHSKKSLEGSQWNISALIVEEYFRSYTRYNAMTAIPEDSSLQDTFPDAPVPPSIINVQPTPVTSRTSSHNVLGPSVAQKISAADGIISEPRAGSLRSSFEFEPRRSHDSSFSSLPLIFSSTTPNSPPGARSSTHEVGAQARESNTASSEQLLSEDSKHNNMYLENSTSPLTSIRVIAASEGSDADIVQSAGITLQLTAQTPLNIDHNVNIFPPQNLQRPDQQPRANTDRTLGRRRLRVSLPSADRASRSREAKQQQSADEEKGYEVKTRLLEQTSAANHRIRQLLNRISVSIREYESAQSNSMASLGIKYIGLPRDLTDAFGHDPAAVTGATRRFHGWRAVDDIQNRLLRQREVFKSFLFRAHNGVSVPRSVLKDPIIALIQAMEALEKHSGKISGRAKEVEEALKAVQETHDRVKKDYNQTLSRTSVVYPELSNIVALEESYKDQYQQFWEFGMDTLTFLLDTVTPFWRTYGKPIGEDIRDFLIIPLYRHEFTGESKRYPILRIPTRSVRHWLGLIVFFLLSVTVTILQSRAAISSATHYKLSMIPYESIRWTALPFFWISIIIQWWAAMVESIVVFLQLAVLVWWAGWSVRIFA